MNADHKLPLVISKIIILMEWVSWI